MRLPYLFLFLVVVLLSCQKDDKPIVLYTFSTSVQKLFSAFRHRIWIILLHDGSGHRRISWGAWGDVGVEGVGVTVGVR